MSGETPRQAFRIPLAIIQPAKAKAKVEGITLTSVVVAALEDYNTAPYSADSNGTLPVTPALSGSTPTTERDNR